jgi:hypothetical protein
VVTGEIMASFAVKPPPFPGAARRSDGKKRTSEEKGKRLFFFDGFSVGTFCSEMAVSYGLTGFGCVGSGVSGLSKTGPARAHV